MPKFTVSLSNDQPVIGTDYDFTTANGFTKCGEYLTQPPPAAAILVTCAPNVSGRYVYIHVQGTAYVQVCDVLVYGKGKLPKRPRK